MTRDFRSEALATRSAAQERLRSLRAARRASRHAGAPSPTGPSPAPIGDRAEAADPAGRAEPAPDPTPPDAAGGAGGKAGHPAPRVLMQVSAAALDLSRSAGRAALPPDAAAPAGRPQESAQDPAPDTDAAPASGEAPAATDLGRLPGIGPGLIQLFARAGVHRLDDLARSDPDQLRRDLGLAGQLLDLDAWIAIAGRQGRLAASDADTDPT